MRHKPCSDCSNFDKGGPNANLGRLPCAYGPPLPRPAAADLRHGGSSTWAVLFTVAALSFSAAEAPAQLIIPWHTIDGGGGTSSSGGGLELSGSIGQPDAGVMTGGSFELVGGFWNTSSAGVPQGSGDCDADGDVDLADYADLPGCLDGPGGGLGGPECDCFDLDADADVDLLDFAEFQASFGQ